MKKKVLVDTIIPSYNQLSVELQRVVSWKSFPYQDRFKEFFIYNDNARGLFETIRASTLYESPDEGILRLLCSNSIKELESDKVYSYFHQRRLWNPFSVLVGTQTLYIFPYRNLSVPNIDFRSLKYSKTNNVNSLYMGIHLARLLTTFISVPKVRQYYKLELSPHHLWSPYGYSLSYDYSRSIITIKYGARGFDFGYRADSLLTRIKSQIAENLDELFKDCPYQVAWAQREQVCRDYCRSNIDHSVFPFNNYNTLQYPFYYSSSILNQFKFSHSGLPFRIL